MNYAYTLYLAKKDLYFYGHNGASAPASMLPRSIISEKSTVIDLFNYFITGRIGMESARKAHTLKICLIFLHIEIC